MKNWNGDNEEDLVTIFDENTLLDVVYSDETMDNDLAQVLHKIKQGEDV